jgi:TPR repeat protein/Flp pilus assembly protein TadD
VRFYLQIACLVAIAALTWSTSVLAQQAPTDEQRKLTGVVGYLEHFTVRRVLEAVGVDASQVDSFRRVPGSEPESWSVTGTVVITDLAGKQSEQPYSAELQVLCGSVERRGCWDLATLTLGHRTLSGASPTVVTLAELNADSPEPATAVGAIPKDEAFAGLETTTDGATAAGQDTDQLRALAEKGDPAAEYQLAESYRTGFPLEQDTQKALDLYTRSAAQGDADAQFRLGELYEEGEIVERDLTKAVEAYHQAAEQGHAGAQYALAHIYHLGSGVEQDMNAAMIWYKKAALQGDEWSQLALGDQYRIGLAVPRDLEQSTKWYRRAADQGNIFAQYELGNAYRYGNGVAPDPAQAMSWYRRSAEAGNPSAQLALTELQSGGTASVAPAPPKTLETSAGAPQPAAEPLAPAPDEDATFSESAMAEIAEEKAATTLSEPATGADDGVPADGVGASGGDQLALVTLPPVNDEQTVADLLVRAQDQMAQLALTTPAGDNAYESYKKVLAVQPDNEAARAGLRRIGVEYAALAQQAAARGGNERAHEYLDKAQELAPDHPDVAAAATAVAALETPLSTPDVSAPSASSVAVSVTPPGSSGAATAESAGSRGSSASSQSGDIEVSALTAEPGAAGGGETAAIPRTKAPKPELLTSGLLYAVSGLDAHQAGRYEEAIEFYTLAIEAGDLPDRSLAYVHNNRGASYRNLNRYNEAIEDYDAAIRLNPDYATAFYNRGIAYDLKGFHSLAIDDFDTAIRLNPDLSDAYTQRGLAYVRDGRYDIAIENFSEAIRLDPESDSAYFNRGLAYQSKGESERAAADIKKSHALNPDNPAYGQKMRELGIL